MNESPDNDQTGEKHCGFVAIVGRPNVGKSTLLNHLLGQKLSITSRKPQTTRHRLLGIKTTDYAQIIYVDTPGLHSGIDRAINRYMNRAVTTAIHDVDLILFMLDGMKWTDEDELVLQNLKNTDTPVMVLINKTDKIADKEALLPYIENLTARGSFVEIIPLSALKGKNMSRLEPAILNYLPKGQYLFPDDQLTDKNARFFAAEFIREKITRQMGDEIPYEATVEIEEFKQENDILHISALILVEREGQKRILIGRQGAGLKSIGMEARRELETLFESRIMLNLWVKVKTGWSDDERALKSLGYTDFE